MTSPLARKMIFLVVAAACLAGGVVVYLVYARPGPSPPAVPRAGVEPAVWTAIDNARQAVEDSPRSAEAWGRLGMVLFAHRFPAEAAICFTAAENRNAGDPRWPYYQGMALAVTDPEGALRQWQSAVDLSSAGVDAPRLRLAEALQAAGRHDEALIHFEKILEQEPDHPLAHLGLARSSLALGQDRNCLQHLTFALRSPFTRKTAYSLQASVHERLGEHKAAEEDARNAVQLPADLAWPNPFAAELGRLRVDRRARLTRATQFIEQGHARQGLALLNELVQEEPDFVQAWIALGYACLEVGDYGSAERALDMALRLAPDAADGHFYRGCLAYNQGKIATAEACFRRAVERKPDYALALYQLGLCRERLDDPAGASAAFQAAIACRPNLAEAHRAWGALLIKEGRRQQAVQQLLLALELKPDDRAATQMLNELKKAAK